MVQTEHEKWKAGCVYLMWCLYQAQLGSRAISVSQELWTALVTFYKVASKTPGLSQAARIVCLLKPCFSFVSMTTKEIQAASEAYLERAMEEAAPTELLKQAETELGRLDSRISDTTTLFDGNALQGLDSTEVHYGDEKGKVKAYIPEADRLETARTGIARDLSQARRDWANAAVLADRNDSGTTARKVGRPRKMEAPQRAATAPPQAATACPPEYLLNAEHMPSLF